MLFLVDGYNVTMSDPATRELTIESQRAALCARLSVSGHSLLGPGRVVVVFDAADGTGSGGGREGRVEVVYALNHKADDEIVELATAESGMVTVVSNDGGIARRVRGDLGGRVRVVAAQTCFHDAVSSAGRVGAPGVSRDVGIPRGGNDITEWYRKQLEEQE